MNQKNKINATLQTISRAMRGIVARRVMGV